MLDMDMKGQWKIYSVARCASDCNKNQVSPRASDCRSLEKICTAPSILLLNAVARTFEATELDQLSLLSLLLCHRPSCQSRTAHLDASRHTYSTVIQLSTHIENPIFLLLARGFACGDGVSPSHLSTMNLHMRVLGRAKWVWSPGRAQTEQYKYRNIWHINKWYDAQTHDRMMHRWCIFPLSFLWKPHQASPRLCYLCDIEMLLSIFVNNLRGQRENIHSSNANNIIISIYLYIV